MSNPIEIEIVNPNVPTHNLQTKIVTPSKETQVITADEGYYGLREVIVSSTPFNNDDVIEEIDNVKQMLTDGANATPEDIVLGKTAYVGGKLITGTNKANTFKKYLDESKSAYHLFYYSHISDFTDYISYEDTSNVTNMYQMFCYSKATIIPPLDSRKVTNFSSMFEGCSNLITISELDFIGVNMDSVGRMFYNCKNLQNLKLLNIQKGDLQVGSGSSWGHLLTLESLLGLCQECIYKFGNHYILTVGTANLEKLANVYVKLTNEPEQTNGLTKRPMAQCESTDEGAMTISEYMTLKNWELA